MINYTLLNKQLDKKLVHPKTGVWYSSSLEEARSMLVACHEYLKATHLEHLIENFVIINLETEEEILD